VIPNATVRKVVEQHQKAEAELRDATTEVRELAAEDGQARAGDIEATARALAEGRDDPGPQRQREHTALLEAAERRRDARSLLANNAWSELLAVWEKNRDALHTAADKKQATARQRWQAALSELEQARDQLAEAEAVVSLVGDEMTRWTGPQGLTVLPEMPLHDGPRGGVILVRDTIAAMRALGEPPKLPVVMGSRLLEPGQNVPLSMQGTSVAITPPGMAVERGG
jgi:hypothetical protein